MNNKIETIDWGLIEYNEAWKKQEELFNATIDRKMKNEEIEASLIKEYEDE